MIRRRLLSLEPLRLAAGVSAFLGPVVFGIGFDQAHRFLFRAGADQSGSFKIVDSKGGGPMDTLHKSSSTVPGAVYAVLNYSGAA